MTFEIRPARPGDEGVIVELVTELAAYERLAYAATATAGDISDALFGNDPKVFCEIAEVNGEVVGFAMWFYTFSTFRGRHGLFLEDIFVRPRFRSRGIGKAFLGRLARRCEQENLGRVEWMVLEGNEPAVAFYRSQRATFLNDWTMCRIDGPALKAMAVGAKLEAP